MPETLHLEIPLIEDRTLVSRECINRALEKVDEAVLPSTHKDEKAHFALWEKKTDYDLHDTVRTKTSASWQALVCVTAGTSGEEEPFAAGIGDFVADHTVVWKSVPIAESGSIDAWRNQAVYKAKDLVIYQKKLYRCLSGHTSGASFEADKWEEISASIAAWKSHDAYSAGDFVIYENALYQCTAEHLSSEQFDAAKWQIIQSGATLIQDWTAATEYRENQVAIESRKLYRCKADHTSDATDFFTDLAAYWDEIGSSVEDWAAGKYYKTGDLVLQGRKLYRCLAAHTAAGFTADFAAWELLSGTELTDWTPDTGYKKGEAVLNDGRLYRCKAGHVSGTAFAPPLWQKIGFDLAGWTAETDYAAGDVVCRNRLLYRCTAAHTSSDFLSEKANWELICGALTVYDKAEPYYTGQLVLRNGLLYVKN